jgi:hypothetical protein
VTAGRDRIGSVRIDRLVMRNVALAPHAARVLPELIAAELGRGGGARDTGEPIRPTVDSLAAAVAHRVRTEVTDRRR